MITVTHGRYSWRQCLQTRAWRLSLPLTKTQMFFFSSNTMTHDTNAYIIVDTIICTSHLMSVSTSALRLSFICMLCKWSIMSWVLWLYNLRTIVFRLHMCFLLFYWHWWLCSVQAVLCVIHLQSVSLYMFVKNLGLLFFIHLLCSVWYVFNWLICNWYILLAMEQRSWYRCWTNVQDCHWAQNWRFLRRSSPTWWSGWLTLTAH